MALLESRFTSPEVASGAPLRAEPFIPGTTIARYRIIELAGSGAMGDVYRAHDRMLDRDVALKVLPSHLVHDRDRVRRFAQEARAASALSHPNIVTIYDVGEQDGVAYIAMELLEGKSLQQVLRDTPRLPIATIVDLVAQVADGQVLRVHVIPGGDLGGGEADDLPVAAHRVARAHGAPCDLVAGPDVLPRLDSPVRVLEHRAGGDLALRDGDVVLGLQDDGHIGDRVSRHARLLSSEGFGQPAREAPGWW